MTSTNVFAVAEGRVDLGAMNGAFTVSLAKRCDLVLWAKRGVTLNLPMLFPSEANLSVRPPWELKVFKLPRL